MSFTREDVLAAELLRDRKKQWLTSIRTLEEKRSVLTGAEKGRVTREISKYKKALEAIDKELEGLPVSPLDPAEVYEHMIDRILKTRDDYEEAKQLFLDRAAVNPGSAITWACEVVQAQEEWNLIQPAAQAVDYAELVATLEHIVQRTKEDLKYESLCNSSSMFTNAVSLAKHKARTHSLRWASASMLHEVKCVYAAGVQSWRLLNEEEAESVQTDF